MTAASLPTNRYILNLSRSSFDRCVLRALLNRPLSGFKTALLHFDETSPCRDFSKALKGYSSFVGGGKNRKRFMRLSDLYFRPAYSINELEFQDFLYETPLAGANLEFRFSYSETSDEVLEQLDFSTGKPTDYKHIFQVPAKSNISQYVVANVSVPEVGGGVHLGESVSTLIHGGSWSC